MPRSHETSPMRKENDSSNAATRQSQEYQRPPHQDFAYNHPDRQYNTSLTASDQQARNSTNSPEVRHQEQEKLIDLDTVQDRMRIDKDKIKTQQGQVKKAKLAYTNAEKKVQSLNKAIKLKIDATTHISNEINKSYKDLKSYQDNLELLESQTQSPENVRNKQKKLEEDKAKVDRLTRQLSNITTEINQLNQEINTISQKKNNLENLPLESYLGDKVLISEKLDMIDTYGNAKPLREKFASLTAKTKKFHSEIQNAVNEYNPNLHKPLEQSKNTMEFLESSNPHQGTHYQSEIDSLIESIAPHIEQFIIVAEGFLTRGNLDSEKGDSVIYSDLDEYLSDQIKSLYDQQIPSTPKKAFGPQGTRIITDQNYVTAETFIKQYTVQTKEHKAEREKLATEIEVLKQGLLDEEIVNHGMRLDMAIQIAKKKVELLDDAIPLAQSIITSKKRDWNIIQEKYNTYITAIKNFPPSEDFGSEQEAQDFRDQEFRDIKNFYMAMKDGTYQDIKDNCKNMGLFRKKMYNSAQDFEQEKFIWEKQYLGNIVTKSIEWKKKIYEHNTFQLRCINYCKEMHKYLKESRIALINTIEQNIETIIQEKPKSNNQIKKSNLEETIKSKKNDRNKINNYLKTLNDYNTSNKKNQLEIDYSNTKAKQKEIKALKDKIKNLQDQLKRDEECKIKSIDDLIANDNLKADADDKVEISKISYINAIKAFKESQEKYLDTLNLYSNTIQAKDFSKENNQRYNELIEYIKTETEETKQQLSTLDLIPVQREQA